MRAMDAPEVRPDRDPRVGSRVVVRHRLERPDPLTGATLTDAVGELVADDDGILVVRTRRGEVRVPRAVVTAVKEIPPSPSRRGKPHRALSVEDLQRVMVGAWPAMETARLGDWVLRASRGFTQRANSVMTAGSPGIAVPDALDAVERWYAVRGLAPNLTLAGPVGFDPADDQVGAEALRRGYRPRVATLTLTAPTRLIADLRQGSGPGGGPDVADQQPVEVGSELTDAWFAAYRAYREVDDEAAHAILTGSPAQAFATVRDGGRRGHRHRPPGAVGRLGWHRRHVGRPAGAPTWHRDRDAVRARPRGRPRRGGVAAPADRHRQHHGARALRGARLRAAPRLRQPASAARLTGPAVRASGWCR